MKTRILATVLSLLLTSTATAESAWHDSFYPYRVSIELAEPASGSVAIDIDSAQIIDLLKPVSIDIMSQDTLAFEKAILVDPQTGQTVGGFVLTPAGEPLDVDGEFASWAAGKPSPWGASPPAHAKLDRVTVEGKSLGVMQVDFPQPVNGRIAQPLTLSPGQLYLLDYYLLADGVDEPLSVSLEDPAKTLFATLHRSYVNRMPPTNVWTHHRVLYRPQFPQAELRLSTAFVRAGAIGGISLRPVKWILQANLPAPAAALDLYVVASAGHRLTDLNASPMPLVEPSPPVKVSKSTASAADFNPDGVMIDAGDGVKLWSVPNHLPMRAETMRAIQPRAAGNGPVRVELCRGTSGTLVLAVETLTSLAQFSQASCDLPIQAEFNRIAPIPVFDGFWPAAKQVETRFDALTELNFPQLPPSDSGVHALAVNFSVPADAAPGTFDGTITITVQTQEPMTKTVEIPVALTILPPVIKPMHHFQAMFGSGQITAKYLVSHQTGFIKDSVSVAEFHGIEGEGLDDDWISRLSRPDRDEPQKAPVRELGKKYNSRLLDFGIVPQLPHLFSGYSYTIVDQGEGKAPKLSDWKFGEFDKAVDELVIGKDSPWIVVWHTNGHQMDAFDLRDGTVYSHLPGTTEKPRTMLPREQYVSLIADYFEAIAAHLQSKGVLDRAMILIDESATSTFPIMYDIASAIRARPNAKHIRFGHTTYYTGTYTQKLPDGRAIMDEVLDVPMPINDEHFNHYEPEWAGRLTRPGKQNWVYYVETDHLNLDNAGLSTVITPLKLRQHGVRGWYCWAPMVWSMPYDDQKLWGSEYSHGPLVNPWLNPYYHHGHGMLSFFYPPDPRGPAAAPTDTIIPSYRLALIRDGIRDYALLDVLENAVDDAGNPVMVNEQSLADAQAHLKPLWTGNTVQWYLSHESYRRFSRSLQGAFGD